MTSEPNQRNQLTLLLVLMSLSIINDFFFIAAKTGEQILLIDYAFKLTALVVVVSVPALRGELKGQFGLPRSVHAALPSIAAVIGLIVLHLLLVLFVEWPLYKAFPETRLFTFHGNIPPSWRLFDLTCGIALTAVAEEIINRGLTKAILTQYLPSRALFYATTALIFGAAHWSGGVGQIVAAVLIGLAFMWVYLRLGSLWPVILAHYLIDVILFWKG